MSPKKKSQRKNPSPKSPAETGRFAYDGLDRVLHEKARLGILASLAANEQGLLFNDLKQLCALTDGNLSRHLGVLSDAVLVEIGKETSEKRSLTRYRLTSEGRQRFIEYIGVLEKVIEDAQTDRQQTSKRPGISGNWSTA